MHTLWSQVEMSGQDLFVVLVASSCLAIVVVLVAAGMFP
jgi:hypothetical protein